MTLPRSGGRELAGVSGAGIDAEQDRIDLLAWLVHADNFGCNGEEDRTCRISGPERWNIINL